MAARLARIQDIEEIVEKEESLISGVVRRLRVVATALLSGCVGYKVL